MLFVGMLIQDRLLVSATTSAPLCSFADDVWIVVFAIIPMYRSTQSLIGNFRLRWHDGVGDARSIFGVVSHNGAYGRRAT